MSIFIDFRKAFDKVQHDKLIENLQNITLDSSDMRLIKKTYCGHQDILSLYFRRYWKRVNIGGTLIKDVRFADDTTIMAESAEDLQTLLES